MQDQIQFRRGERLSAAKLNHLAYQANRPSLEQGGLRAGSSVVPIKIRKRDIGGVAPDSFPWSKLSFGYSLTTKAGETEEDDDLPAVNINAGSVRMHGLRVYTYTPPEGGSKLPLVGDDCIVFAEISRVSSEDEITLSAQTVMTASTATTLRIPLYTFTKIGGAYALQVIHNMGDINIDQPIR
jgi:hypothetical protein